MMLLIALLTVFLAVLVVYKNRGVQPSSVWFALAMVIISVIQLAHYFAFAGASTTWMAIFFMHPSPLYYLLGPFIFFYIRGTLKDEMRLRPKDVWHFIPCLIHIIGIMPYILKPWSFKLYVAEQMMQDVHYMVIADDLMLYPVIINIIMRPVTWVGYTGYALFLLLRFQRKYPVDGRVPINHARYTLRFMLIFLVICLLTQLSYTALSVEYFLHFDKPTAAFINTPWIWATNLGVAAIPFILILYPEILYGIPHIRKSEDQHDGVAEQSEKGTLPVILGQNIQIQDLKSRDSDASHEKGFEDLAAKIIETMELQQPFLKPDFSPDDLASMLDVPKHHLYYCFSKILNTRFTRLRAEYRVRYAQRLIDMGATRNKTLEAIGQESGFSNRISFNNAFREVAGLSPTDYLRKVLKNE